jgi:hypothetical protein
MRNLEFQPAAGPAPEEPQSAPVPTPRRRPVILLIASAGAVVLLALAAAWLWMPQPGGPVEPAKPVAVVLQPAARPEPRREPLRGNSIDDFVRGQLAWLKLEPASRCSDEVFLRRVYLDVIGVLPTAAEAREFLGSAQPDKRRLLIEKLLARTEFADYWAMKWGDLLRIKAEFPVNLWPNAAQAYHRWVRASIAENKPYDQFARELLTSSGSNFRVGPANFYRAMQDRTPAGIASTVALTFLGERAESWPA